MVKVYLSTLDKSHPSSYVKYNIKLMHNICYRHIIMISYFLPIKYQAAPLSWAPLKKETPFVTLLPAPAHCNASFRLPSIRYVSLYVVFIEHTVYSQVCVSSHLEYVLWATEMLDICHSYVHMPFKISLPSDQKKASAYDYRKCHNTHCLRQRQRKLTDTIARHN